MIPQADSACTSNDAALSAEKFTSRMRRARTKKKKTTQYPRHCASATMFSTADDGNERARAALCYDTVVFTMA